MYVPGAVTVFTFEGWSTPSRSRCQPWLCRSPELPMLSNGSLYSLTVHVEDSVTGAPPLVQFQLPAWLQAQVVPDLVARHAHGQIAVDPRLASRQVGQAGPVARAPAGEDVHHVLVAGRG